MRALLAPTLLLALTSLAACNSSGPPAAPEPAAYRSPVTPAGFKLPEGTGCAGEIARYRAVMDNDKRSGHVGDKVYDTIREEINGAETACSAGNQSQSLSLVHASKVRHGYPG